MKKKGFLDFYNTYAPTGNLPCIAAGYGLCFSFDPDYNVYTKSPYSSKKHSEILELFHPTTTDLHEYGIGDRRMWGKENVWEELDTFNTFRQTVVLFCAAINNEL